MYEQKQFSIEKNNKIEDDLDKTGQKRGKK